MKKKWFDVNASFCRVVPRYVAINYDYFVLVPQPRYLPESIEDYCAKIKKKIACLKRDFEV